jgi:hypothetical protein
MYTWDNKPERKPFTFMKLRFTIHTKDCKVYRIQLCEWTRYQIMETFLLSVTSNHQFAMFIRRCLSPIIIMALEILYLIFPNNSIIIPNSEYMISKPSTFNFTRNNF